MSYLDNGDHWGWYVNLQEPFRRTLQGIQTMDLMLDILIERDRSWRLKDEDDFQILLTRGLLDSDAAQRVREEAADVVGKIERGEQPFDGSWSHWRPDPQWPPPALPADWDALGP